MAATAALTNPHLANLLADLLIVRAEAERFASLSGAQLTWRPGAGDWSIADCFEHLRIVDAGYSQAIRQAVGQAEPGNAAFAPTWYARAYIHFVSPGSTLKMPTLPVMKPAVDSPSAGADALQHFLQQQAELEALIREADTKNINTGRFSSPFAALMRLSVGEGLTLLVRHEQRHTLQAQRLTEQPAFPEV